MLLFQCLIDYLKIVLSLARATFNVPKGKCEDILCLYADLRSYPSLKPDKMGRHDNIGIRQN